MAIREASMCPSGRLMAWDRTTGKPFEFRFAPSLGLIEDPAIGSSGTYEIRNRAGPARRRAHLRNPQPCDGTHALREVGQQTLLRRHARSRQMARRPRGRTGRGAAARRGLLTLRNRVSAAAVRSPDTTAPEKGIRPRRPV